MDSYQLIDDQVCDGEGTPFSTGALVQILNSNTRVIRELMTNQKPIIGHETKADLEPWGDNHDR